MSTVHSKKPVRTTAKMIVSNHRRRSRSEGTLFHLSMSSYPHAVIGNITKLIHDDEKALRDAVFVERNLTLLEFIRLVTISIRDYAVSFNCASIQLDVDMTKAKALEVSPSTCFEYSAPKINDSSGLVNSLLHYFHGVQVRGMTRKFPFEESSWETQSSSLHLDKESIGLNGLNLKVVSNSLSLAELRDHLIKLLSQSEVDIEFGTDAIQITDSQQSLKVFYKSR